ncbi:hypothetical protein HQQ81_02835 [Microbacteriaceae bacterium VKM Ac-2854]|nr:hypothetical protein [Microbacteriaceae bacterium VKM Ac-2854]
MVEFLIGIAVVAGVGGVLAMLIALAIRARRHGTAGAAFAAAMAAYDEAMHPAAHEQFVELRIQDERTAPTETNGG